MPHLKLAARMADVTDSPIMALIRRLASTPPEKRPISFASGLPDPALFPREKLARIAGEVIAGDSAALQYGPTEGLSGLRTQVSEILKKRGFKDAKSEGVVITTGSQQGIDLVARLVLNPGDAVAVESPTYLAALQAFSASEATFAPLDLSSNPSSNPSSESLIAQLSASPSRPKLVYLTPTHANPTGLTLPLKTRTALRLACTNLAIPILEDDAYHELSFSEPPVAISALEGGSAIYLGTFSKSIAPGLRVGFLYSPDPEIIQQIGRLKQLTDLHASTVSQLIVSRYLLDPSSESDVQTIRSAYRERRDAILEALESQLGPLREKGLVEWTQPSGGMFLMLTLPEHILGDELLEKCWDAGVIFVPGASFYPEFEGEGAQRAGNNTVRLNFVSEPVERIQKGVEILARVIKQELGEARG